MLAITLGFGSTKSNADPVVLYCGTSSSEAREFLLNPPAGIAHTRLFLNPLHTRARRHEVPGDVVETIEPPTASTVAPETLELDPESPEEIPTPEESPAPGKPASLSGLVKKTAK